MGILERSCGQASALLQVLVCPNSGFRLMRNDGNLIDISHFNAHEVDVSTYIRTKFTILSLFVSWLS